MKNDLLGIHGKISKSHMETVNLKYQLLRGMINLNYLMNQILDFQD